MQAKGKRTLLEFRKLKAGDRLHGLGDIKNRGMSWSSVTIDWGDGDSISVSHNDIARMRDDPLTSASIEAGVPKAGGVFPAIPSSRTRREINASKATHNHSSFWRIPPSLTHTRNKPTALAAP